MSILVTGGAGFIGHNFINHVLVHHPETHIISLDNAPESRRKLMAEHRPTHDAETIPIERSGVFDVVGDIRDQDLVRKLFQTHEIETVFHFAAESHVDRSIDGPLTFMETNALGTCDLLQVVQEYVKDGAPNGFVFIMVSTDEVYGSTTTQKVKFFTEDAPLLPGNPYAASKAAAEMACLAYYNTYGLPIMITRCCNNYGPFQMPEKLIPKIICNCIEDKPLPVYGSGKQEREWIHVNDHAAALWLLSWYGTDGEIYNISSRDCQRNIDLVKLIKSSITNCKAEIKHVKDRPGHDMRYAVSPAKLEALDWSTTISLEDGIPDTIEWYLKNQKWVSEIEACKEFTRDRVGLGKPSKGEQDAERLPGGPAETGSGGADPDEEEHRGS